LKTLPFPITLEFTEDLWQELTTRKPSLVLRSAINFTYNAASDGGVFSALFESRISCSECIFAHNFGLQSGIISVYQDGYFDLNAEIF